MQGPQQVLDQAQVSLQPPSARKNRNWSRWVLATIFVLGFGGFYAFGLNQYFSWDYVQSHVGMMQTQIQEHLIPVLVVFALLYAAVTALSVPVAAVMTLAAGALFGRFLGTGAVSLASTLGATLAFLSSRYLFQSWVQERFGNRLQGMNEGVEREGGYYLFTLRLVPLFPFFLINLGMGLTRMRTLTFAWVSLLGMLPGTFLYVNAGTELSRIDSPKDVLSTSLLVSLALLGLVPLVLRQAIQGKLKVSLRTLGIVLAVALITAAAAIGVRHHLRYAEAESMELPLKEFTNAEYPEDPAGRSVHFGQYSERSLQLVKKDDTHFDFLLKPTNSHTASISFRNVDVSLLTPGEPEWTKTDPGLERIALTDRQWNRQQVRFDVGSPHLEVSGGNGFEKTHLFSAELAKNCLNAGLWEVLLFVKEDGNKALYYQGWFTFPLGHYKAIFELKTGLSYWRHGYYLEHWFDPARTPMKLEDLRRITQEKEATVTFDRTEEVLALGEQARKRRTTIANNLVTWDDFYGEKKIRFATFIPPGRYSVQHPWKNEYWRMNRLEKAIFREILSPATSQPQQELELVFESDKGNGPCRFIVGGFDLAKVPRLAVEDYPKGMYMPMGIGVPPFYQTYEELKNSPPERSPYFCLMLDGTNRWINHHDMAVDGPVLHRDVTNPKLLHVYLLSYERHTLIAHYVIKTA